MNLLKTYTISNYWSCVGMNLLLVLTFVGMSLLKFLPIKVQPVKVKVPINNS